MSLFGKSYKKLDSLTGGYITKTIVNKFVQDYGEMLNFSIDKQNKKIQGDILLKGETGPLYFLLTYEVSRDMGKYFLTITSAKVEREWIEALMKNFLIGKRQEIPADKFKLIANLLV